jgi:hypothetical protein
MGKFGKLDKMEEEGVNPTNAIHETCKKVVDSKLDVKFTQGKLLIEHRNFFINNNIYFVRSERVSCGDQ